MKSAWIIPAGLLLLAAAPAGAQDTAAALGPVISDLAGAVGGSAGSDAGGALSGRLIQLIGLLTVLSLAPGLMVVMTSFTRFVIVFSMLRQALGLGQTPPNMVLTSLAMFMTFFVMQPVFTDAWEDGLSPLIEGAITEEQALARIGDPFHRFMAVNVREQDLALFARMAQRGAPAETATTGTPEGNEAADPVPLSTQDLLAAADNPAAVLPADLSEVPWTTLVPAFMISELRRAFTIGFLIYLPFIVIDLVVAAVLMAGGMMMLSPVMISLPFKIIFFVLIDGWYMLAGSLMQSYAGV